MTLADVPQIILATTALFLAAGLFVLIYRNFRKPAIGTPSAREMEKEVRERTAALQEAVQHLKEIDRVKTEFISLASHQLRTPLTGLRWAHHALLEGQVGEINDEQRKLLERSLDRTEAMMGLVGELLDVARIEDQKYRLVKENVDISDLVKFTIDQFNEAAARRNIIMEISIEDGMPPFIGDKSKLNIALGNLIDNAIKYTPAGGTVSVSASKDQDEIVFTVKDNGIGIPKADLFRTFSKFFRSSNAIAMHTRGSGLGLYIVHTIVEKHGGRVSVDSREEEGSTFTIRLPIT